jgi:hypothetical protein
MMCLTRQISIVTVAPASSSTLCPVQRPWPRSEPRVRPTESPQVFDPQASHRTPIHETGLGTRRHGGYHSDIGLLTSTSAGELG